MTKQIELSQSILQCCGLFQNFEWPVQEILAAPDHFALMQFEAYEDALVWLEKKTPQVMTVCSS